MMEVYILSGVIFWLILSIVLNNREHRKQLQAQQDTIQKLLNREPVTYKEVGAQPPKPDTDRFVAWGGTIANRDEL